MIKDNQKVFNRLLVIIDALITAVSFVLAYYIKFYILNDGPGIGVLPVQDYYMLLPFIVPGYMFLYYRCSVYSPKRTVRRRHEIYSILQANTIGRIPYHHAQGIAFHTEKGYNLKHILLVGYSRAAEEYIDRILSNPPMGICSVWYSG